MGILTYRHLNKVLVTSRVPRVNILKLNNNNQDLQDV